MKSVILGLVVALMVTPAFAAGRSRRVYQAPQSKVYSIPTVGKTTYTVESPAVAKPSCKDGKCSLRR